MGINAGRHLDFFKRYGKDLYGGVLTSVLGAGAAFAGSQYKIGTLSRMGPGFFPVTVGGLLVLVGIAIMLSAKEPDVTPPIEEKRPPEWRAWIFICVGIAAFVVLGRWGGLLPATFAIVFISALGDRDNTWISALVLGVAMTVVAGVVFYWALQLQFPLLTWG
ncbi:Tripartite tricarboxylate transporter TctB family protein [Caballeronia sordidicola]|uniref:Tripartite tricarboxylate transporter TctB family protein n=1 Tax=Caballeronia sordidicola TaxID=196367 RepID=A0A158I0F8_CABSO|nr:tripartite tricarboxylate transporter TctB family protein [Caballeronia sordidicola]SAL49937.1 Tripartite tricarboxylate transporter TctB family protein [Caballeronia sordidicola]